MKFDHLLVSSGPKSRTCLSDKNEVLQVPEDWDFLPAGDALLTRRVKSQTLTWVVQVKVKRRMISKGIWAPKEIIFQKKHEVEELRSTPQYSANLTKQRDRRAQQQDVYRKEFHGEVLLFLGFDKKYSDISLKLADLITETAIPVGSGTVARTTRIPINERAAAATLAWMRHNTTSYDSMKIPRIKGERRKIRRKLIQKSLLTLQPFRDGVVINDNCPIQKILKTS